MKEICFVLVAVWIVLASLLLSSYDNKIKVLEKEVTVHRHILMKLEKKWNRFLPDYFTNNICTTCHGE